MFITSNYPPNLNESEKAWCAAKTAEQRSERLRKRRERNHARCAAQTASERQAISQQKSTHECERMAVETPEEKDYSRRVPMNAKECPWGERKKITADEHHPAQKVGSWNPRGERKITVPTSTKDWQLKPLRERKITADEHQPVWKVGSWNPWRELRLECYSTRYMEQQSVKAQLPLFQQCSIQAKMWKHGHIGYTDMLHLFRKISWPPFPL